MQIFKSSSGSTEIESTAFVGWGPVGLILCLPFCMAIGWLLTIWGGCEGLDSMGNPIGGDFAMFYIAGQLALTGQWNELYNEPLQQSMLRELFPAIASDSYLPFRYPPMVACVMAPLACLPFGAAFLVFSILSISAWIGSLLWLKRTLFPNEGLEIRPESKLILLAIAASPVVLQTWIDGQASAFWFSVAAGCWCCLRRERFVLGGCILAMAACKPNVMALLTVALVVRYPRILWGLLPTGCIMLTATWIVVGTDCLEAYRQLSQKLALRPWDVETPYWKVQSLLSWSEFTLGPSARSINLVLGAAAALTVGIVWRMRSSNAFGSAGCLCAGLAVNGLFNPYTPVYDLALLSLGMIVLLAEAEKRTMVAAYWVRRDVQTTAFLLLFGPILSQSLSHATESHLQLLPLALVFACVYWLAASLKAGREKKLLSPQVSALS